MTHDIYQVRSPPIQASQSPARHTASLLRRPQPSLSKGRVNPFARTLGVLHRASGSNIKFHQFTKSLGINGDHGVYVPERFNYVSTPPHHTLKPAASSCSLGQLENEYAKEGRDKEILLECLHFPISPRFTEHFWHLSNSFVALADHQNGYLNTLFTSDVALYRMYQKNDPLLSSVWFFTSHTDRCKQPDSQSQRRCSTQFKITSNSNITSVRKIFSYI